MRPIIGMIVLLFANSSISLGESGQFELIGSVAFPGDATDDSAANDKIAPNKAGDLLGGFSAMDYIGDDQYLVLPDRGPGDSENIYQCRFFTIRIKIDPAASPKVTGQLLGTTRLTDSTGQPLVGDPRKYSSQKGEESLRFDPEGIRLLGKDSVVISDEYGPHVYLFTRDGMKIKEFAVPDSYKVDFSSADASQEIARNTKGRQANAGFEGLAVTPSGNKVVALLQKPLIQDSEDLGNGSKRGGVNCRMVVFNPIGQPVNEFVYTLEENGLGVSEMLAVDEHQFLVMERDSKSGLAAKNKKIFLIDLRNATDVSKIESLPIKSLPIETYPKGPVDGSDSGGAIRSVGKRLVLDLLSPASGIARESIEEKQECLSFGPTLADGRRTLILGIDNDFDKSAPSLFYVYAVNQDAFADLE